jgi:hypothetical protein
MRVKFFLILITFAMFGASSVHADRCVQTKNELPHLLGLDDVNDTVYASISSSENQCNCKEVRFAKHRTNPQMALSILLAAKLSNRTVRIDFEDGMNCNSAYRIYLEGE